jgi:two-component system, NarL family, nitrate/nitrite response regulator NarL
MLDKPIRIVIASGQPVARERFCRFLAADAGLAVIGEASDANYVSQLVRQIKPDILLVDLDMARGLELQTLCNLPNSSPLRIVLMVFPIQKAHIVEAFLLNAHGIVLATATPGLLIESIRSVMAGQYWLEHESVGLLVQALREVLPRREEPGTAKDYGLTPRELDIIKKIVNGRSNKEVGEEFAISERTVKHHLTNIFGKIGVSSRLQLALFAVNHHLMSSQAPAMLVQTMQSEREG